MIIVSFEDCLQSGGDGEKTAKYFLDFLGIEYMDTRDQRCGHDYYSHSLGKIEVKRNFDIHRKRLFVEEDHNSDPNIASLYKGWLHTTDSNFIWFVDKGNAKNEKKAGKLIVIFRTKDLKSFYCTNKSKYPLLENSITYKNGRPRNRSTYRDIPLEDIPEHLYIVLYSKN